MSFVNMSGKFLNLLFAFVCVLTLCICANAQNTDASSSSGRGSIKEDLPDGLKETLAKQRIKSEEKEYQELVLRGEEAAKLGEELDKSLEASQKFSADDIKKLDRLEKIVKKIRSDLGGKDEDDKDIKNASSEDKPSSLQIMVKNIKEDSANLLSEIKKIGRHSISVVAIESSNTLLKLVRFLRFSKN